MTDSEFVAVDTNVLSYLARSITLGRQYQSLLGDRLVAISFQVETELLGMQDPLEFGSRRREALSLLLEDCVCLPLSDANSTWYNRVNRTRREKGNGANDGDVWVVAQALEHDLPLMLHDRQAALLASAMDVEVWSLLTNPEPDWVTERPSS